MKFVRFNAYINTWAENKLCSEGEYEHNGLTIRINFSEALTKEILELVKAEAEVKIVDILKTMNEDLGIEHG